MGQEFRSKVKQIDKYGPASIFIRKSKIEIGEERKKKKKIVAKALDGQRYPRPA